MWRATIGGMIAVAALVWLWPSTPPSAQEMARSAGGGLSGASQSPSADAARRHLPRGGRRSAGNGIDTVTLIRAADGHFYADAEVNDARVRFLVDTGASQVALTQADAKRANLGASESEFTQIARTAGGETGVKPVTIERLKLGPLEARAVEGAVVEAGLPISLLGQSFLARVGKVEIEGETMRLK